MKNTIYKILKMVFPLVEDYRIEIPKDSKILFSKERIVLDGKKGSRFLEVDFLIPIGERET